MIKKTISYTDYDGNARTDELYFNLNQAEIMEWEHSYPGGLVKLLEKIVAATDTTQIVRYFKELILKSYGVKSPDGKQFNKSEQIVNDFVSTEAYSILFMELGTDNKAAAEFVKGIMPDTTKTLPAANAVGLTQV